MRGEAERWLAEAKWDLETARILHKNGRYNAAAFYSHQAAEKPQKQCYTAPTKLPGDTASEYSYKDTMKPKGKQPRQTYYPMPEN